MLSDDQNIEGTYRLAIVGSVPTTILTDQSEFNLNVYPGECLQEFVSPDGTLGPIDYIIGSGVNPLQPTWTSSVQIFTCPAWFKIYYWSND